MPIATNDPRVGGPRNANERLADATIRHALHVVRLGSGESIRMIEFLEENLFPEIEALLVKRLTRMNAGGRPANTGLYQTKRYQEMHAAMAALIREAYAELLRSSVKSLVEIGRAEVGWQVRTFQRIVPNVIRTDFASPPIRTIRAIVNERPFADGGVLSRWFKDRETGLVRNLQNQLAQGVSFGESVPELVARFRADGGVATRARHSVAAIARTSVNHVTNQARSEVFRENADVVRGEQWVITLDLRACWRCISLDGQIFDIGMGPYAPIHPNDRCQRVAVLKSLREMGIPIDDVDEGTRAAFNGEVAENVHFPEWIQRQEAADQDTVLGRGIAQRLRAGRVEMDELVRLQRARMTKPLTLEQVKRLEERN